MRVSKRGVKHGRKRVREKKVFGQFEVSGLEKSFTLRQPIITANFGDILTHKKLQYIFVATMYIFVATMYIFVATMYIFIATMYIFIDLMYIVITTMYIFIDIMCIFKAIGNVFLHFKI